MRRSRGGQQRARSRIVDGWSESAWKSLAIKSLRIGWPEGLRQAEARLTGSTMQMLLLASVFEDVLPPESELPDVLAEVKGREWEELCGRETHHGRPGLKRSATSNLGRSRPPVIRARSTRRPVVSACIYRAEPGTSLRRGCGCTPRTRQSAGRSTRAPGAGCRARSSTATPGRDDSAA